LRLISSIFSLTSFSGVHVTVKISRKQGLPIPISAAHATIIDQRLAAHDVNPGSVVSWKDAVKEARRQVASKKRKR